MNVNVCLYECDVTFVYVNVYVAWRSDVTLRGSWITPDPGSAAAIFFPMFNFDLEIPWMVRLKPVYILDRIYTQGTSLTYTLHLLKVPIFLYSFSYFYPWKGVYIDRGSYRRGHVKFPPPPRPPLNCLLSSFVFHILSKWNRFDSVNRCLCNDWQILQFGFIWADDISRCRGVPDYAQVSLCLNHVSTVVSSLPYRLCVSLSGIQLNHFSVGNFLKT